MKGISLQEWVEKENLKFLPKSFKYGLCSSAKTKKISAPKVQKD